MGPVEEGDIFEKKKSRPIFYIILAGCLMIALGLALGLGLGLRNLKPEPQTSEQRTTTAAPVTKSKSQTGTYRFAAVAADAAVCSKIGTKILAVKGGSAVDAAIATTICAGVVNRHSAGIGGGFFMTIYNRRHTPPLQLLKFWNGRSFQTIPALDFSTVDTGIVESLDAREWAPLEANETMYINRTDGLTSQLGGLAIAVPGEIRGYAMAHGKYGRLPWKDLFAPTIKMCREGVTITQAILTAILRYEDVLRNRSHTMYFNDDGLPVKLGDKVKYTKLADTMETIANEGADAFYVGSLADDIVQDIQENGGIITMADLAEYNSTWRDPVFVTLRDNLTLYSMPPPGSGSVYGYILNILDGYGLTPDSLSTNEKSVLTYHRIVEAMKFACAKRTDLGDPDFVNVTELVANMTSRDFADYIREQINDEQTYGTEYYGPTFYDQLGSGTTHVSVVDSQHNAVAITSTINTYFGSKVTGSRTGIAFNNEMDDFSTPGTVNFFGVPASPANFIKPKKRPLSSMSPSIVVNNAGDVVLVAGASGGTRITTSTALVSLYTLRLGLPLWDAIDRSRPHHQLLPPYITIEEDFPQYLVDGLKAKGHNITVSSSISVIQAIHVTGGELVAGCDFRKGGAPDGY